MNHSTTTFQNHITRNSATVKIKRLFSVEEELTDRIGRAENGKFILALCRELSGVLTEAYTRNKEDLGELRDTICHGLKESLRCNENHALQIIELALDLVHARILGSYRRSIFDLGNP
jgi:hypothetical protein